MVRTMLCAALVAGLATALAPAAAPASDRVARALLEALRANGTIDAKQYGELQQLIEDEEAAAAASPSAAVAAPPPEKPGKLDVFWKDGIRMESADGAFKLKLGGRLQNDWGVAEPDSDLRDALGGAGQGSGTDWRRVRLALQGTIYERIGTKIEIDFAGGDAALRDAYLEMLKLPYVGTFRVGHFKEPLSLDQLTSDSYTTFIERSLMDAFAPGRNTGFLLQNAPLEQRMTWSLGAFRETDDTSGNGFSDDATYNITSRVTALPWYEGDGERLLHLGVSASQRFRDGTTARFRSRPEVRLGIPNYVDTGDIPADDVQLVTPELAVVYGPFSLQTEYTHGFVQGDSGTEDSDFYGLYAQASWFVTGESRPYKTGEGVFDRVAPAKNFDFDGGLGAWEVALRYSRLDLDDEGIDGGTLDDGTVGVNWYLNPNVRTSINYVLGRLDDVGWTNQFVARFQIDF